MIPTLTPAFIIPEGIGGGISGGGQNVALNSAGVVAAAVIVGGLVVVAAPVVAALAAKASLLTAASPLGLLAVGSFLKGLQQFQDWGFLNHRPAGSLPALTEGQTYDVSTSGNVGFILRLYSSVVNGARIRCDNGNTFAPATSATGVGDLTLVGKSIRIGQTTTVYREVCGSGTNTPSGQVPSITVVRADGSEQVAWAQSVSRNIYNAGITTTLTESITDVGVIFGGVQTRLAQSTPGTFPNTGVRPQLFPQTLPDAPPLPAPPLREPLETPVLPPPPDRRPLAPPVTIPRPGQDPARVPVPGPRPGPAPGPGPSPTPSQPAPAGVPAVGPLPLPIPLPVPTTPGSVVIVDGQPIGGPGQAPAPNLQAIAQELGRLERKAELTLQAGNRGVTRDLLAEIVAREVEALLRSLILGLFDDVPAGSYELQPPCPGPGGGAPAGPDVVEWTPSATPLIDLRKRIDAVAELIQLHKNQGQPTCKTAVSGQEVTIHFESDS